MTNILQAIQEHLKQIGYKCDGILMPIGTSAFTYQDSVGHCYGYIADTKNKIYVSPHRPYRPHTEFLISDPELLDKIADWITR